jgi:hypothetical protein
VVPKVAQLNVVATQMWETTVRLFLLRTIIPQESHMCQSQFLKERQHPTIIETNLIQTMTVVRETKSNVSLQGSLTGSVLIGSRDV